MKKNTKIVDPVNYPDYGDVDYNSVNKKPKKACSKSCKTVTEEEPLVLNINWGWQFEAICYGIIANVLLAIAQLIAIISK